MFPGRIISQNLTDTTLHLGEVTVSAYKVTEKIFNTPGSISVLSTKEMQMTRGDFATLINTIPGITMHSGTLTTNRIVIRGMGSRTPYNSNRIRAYLNDIPVTSADGVSTPEELDIQGLGRIEIIKGPSSAIYGSGLGGSINMYTPLETVTKGSIDVQTGSFGTGKVNIGGNAVNGKFIINGNLGHTYSGGYRENNSLRRTTLLSTTRWEHTGWSLNSTLLLIGVDAGIPSSLGMTLFDNDPARAAPNWLMVKGYKKYFKGTGAVNFRYNTGSGFTFDGLIFGRYNNNFERRPFNDLDDDSKSGGLRIRLNYNIRKAEIVAGTELISEEYTWKLALNNAQINENSELRRHYNIFGMVHYKPSTTLNISLASALNHVTYRLTDRFPGNGDQSGSREFPLIFSPRIGINYSPLDVLAFYASAGHGFSLPSPEETLLPEGDVNTGIKPETGFQYEVGIRAGSSGGKIEIDASLYLIELRNLLVTKRLTEDIFTGINAGHTRHSGIEVLLKTVLFRYGAFPGSLFSSLSYTASLNRFIDFVDNDVIYDGKQLPGIPSQSVQLQLRWKTSDRIEFHSHLQYIGKQYLTDMNSQFQPGYFLASLKGIARFSLSDKIEMEVYSGINNLTNTHYASMLVVNAVAFGNSEPRFFYPGLPRNWNAGLSFRF